MKAQKFLNLVEEMMTVQADYFQAKRDGLIRAKDLLVKAKGLEKQVRDVLKDGRLEPDDLVEPTVTSPEMLFTEEYLWMSLRKNGDDE